jgi:glycosyltransferase involved in cell wall biosynthesis
MSNDREVEQIGRRPAKEAVLDRGKGARASRRANDTKKSAAKIRQADRKKKGGKDELLSQRGRLSGSAFSKRFRMVARSAPTFSIVIETANDTSQREAGEQEGIYLNESLRAILRETRVLLQKPEIIVVDATRGDYVKNVVRKYPGVKRIIRPDADYFACKNEGFLASSGDIVVFFDSDCIPGPGVFRHVQETFRNRDIAVCSGLTHYPLTLAGKAQSLIDFYPVPRHGTSRRLLANNTIVRRDLFARCMFPPLPLRTRASGSIFGWHIQRKAAIYNNPQIRQTHRFYGKLFERRLRSGYDSIAVRRHEPTFPQARLLSRTGILFPFMWYVPCVLNDWIRAVENMRALRIRPWELPVIWAYTAACRLGDVLGMLVTLVNPGYFVRKYS